MANPTMGPVLQSLSEYLQPSPDYSCLCDSVVEELYRILKTNSVFPISGCVLGGGLPSAKNTSTCLKADADMTVFVTWPYLLNSTWIPLRKELILDDWWRVIFQYTVPDNPDDVIQRTANSLHFYYRGVPVDILVGFKFSKNKEKQRSMVLTILRVANRLVQTSYRMAAMTKIIKCLGSDLTDAGVEWMRTKSEAVRDVARLAKFWSQTILYNGCGNGKSFFVELIAVKSAVDEEELNSMDYNRAFKRFLRNMVGIETLRIIFLDFYRRNEIPSSIENQSPLLINPINPFQNLFECVDGDFKTIMKNAAKVTLEKIESGCEGLVNLFYPQNDSELHLLVTMTDHCWSKISADTTLPKTSKVILSDWLKPVLNWSKEKVMKDIYRETRYLIGRIHRLFAAVVLTSELSKLSVPSTVQNLQYLCSKLCMSEVEVKYLEESAMSRDVVFIFPCGEGRTNIHLGFNIYLPTLPE